MTREEIESVYSRDVLDRNWWGNFPEPLDLLGKDFPKTADIYRLMPVCARIALHIRGVKRNAINRVVRKNGNGFDK